MSLLLLCNSGIRSCTSLFELSHYSVPPLKLADFHFFALPTAFISGEYSAMNVMSPSLIDTASPSTAGASSHATNEAVATDSTSLAGNGVENTLASPVNANNAGSDNEDSGSDDSSTPNELIDGVCDAETYYESQNLSLLVLVTMCYGMNDEEDKPILDP